MNASANDFVKIGSWLESIRGWAVWRGIPATLVILLFTLVSPCCGQVVSSGGQSTMRATQMQPLNPDGSVDGGVIDPVFAERRLRQLNAAEHKSMVEDSEKLLKLVTVLNEEIGRTNPSELSSEQLRTVAEIEKLAHRVRDKMTTTFNGAPVYVGPMPIPPFSHR